MKHLMMLSTILVLLAASISTAFAAPNADGHQDIVDIAVEDGRFGTLVAAVTAAELVDTLKSEGPFTVFAPTDDAFAALPEGTVEALLNDLPTLTDILLYHVVPGAVKAEQVVTLDSADTALGVPVNISVEDGQVMVNDAQVIITDIEASNGVIHVIDAVLLPPTEEAAAATETETDEALQMLPESGGVPNPGLSANLLLLVVGAFLIISGIAVRYQLERVNNR